MKNPESWVLREQLMRFTPSTVILLSFLVFSLAGEALSSNPQPHDCEPRHCGNGLNISYPFWITGRQPRYCGYPGFDVACKGDDPVVDDGTQTYFIRDIFYDNMSVAVIAEDRSSSCPYHRHNLSLTRTVFSVSSINRELFFYLNCTERLPGLTVIECSDNEKGKVSLVAVSPVPSNENVSCESVLAWPYLEYGAGEYRSYESLLRNGFLLEWTAPNCGECRYSGGRCGYNWKGNDIMCICTEGVHRVSCDGIGISQIQGTHKRKIILGIAMGASGFLLACITLCCWRYRKHSSLSPIWAVKSRNSQNIEAFLEQYGSSIPKRYGYAEVKKLTKSFTEKLGQGGYGTVFKGKLQDGRLVAVKVLNKSKENAEEFINEVASIGRTHHVNIVSLLGFCCEGSKRALLYEFMPNGSLEKFIFLRNPEDVALLGCKELLEIAIGIAHGLEYLHRGCNTRIVHFDIKPHNILLDEDFCPKISDFGLAKSCRPKQSILSTMGTRGTIGYIAPEVFSRKFGVISSKSDVYSYGMMVLEMVGGRKKIDARIDNTSDIYFPHWIYEHLNDDGILQLCGISDEAEEVARKMILVGLWCIQTSPSSRPSMSKVLEMLQGNFEDLQMPPKPYLSSP